MNNAGGIKNMAIKKEPTEMLWASGGVCDQITDLAKELGWEHGDELIVKIAGTRTSCLQNDEAANPRWHPPYGTVVHNRDAQIVIENISRRDDTKSTPMGEDELLAKFRLSSSGQLHKACELEELPEPSPMADSGGHPWIQIVDRIRKTLSK